MSLTAYPMVQKALGRLQRHGTANTLHLALVRLVNLAVPFKILRGVYVERPDPHFVTVPRSYGAEFLPAAALARFAEDAATELSHQFIDEALTAGDECYAICDGSKLASYGWYATRPTPLDSPELVLHFSARHVYMYKGFTDRRYRGQRLHAIGMTRALAHYLAAGYEGIVSYVESTNFDSLKSCFRMGYQVFGSVYLVRLFGHTWSFSSPGCRRFDFRVETAATPAVELRHGKV